MIFEKPLEMLKVLWLGGPLHHCASHTSHVNGLSDALNSSRLVKQKCLELYMFYNKLTYKNEIINKNSLKKLTQNYFVLFPTF